MFGEDSSQKPTIFGHLMQLLITLSGLIAGKPEFLRIKALAFPNRHKAINN